MNSQKVAVSSRVLFLAALSTLTACTVGSVKDTSGAKVGGAKVVAYAQCGGQGCAAAQTVTATPTGDLTGYKVWAAQNGVYTFDPYAELVPPEAAMMVAAHKGDEHYRVLVVADGFRDVWFDHVPDFTEYQYEGAEYAIDEVPPVYLCRYDQVDTDGDDICDDAEVLYGTSPLLPDTDGDGEYDDQEIYGSGSPFTVQPRKLIHYNVNVSDFDVSKSFYNMLGFMTLLDVNVDVSEPAEAQGLDLPPYSLRAAPMILGGLGGDGFLIDLIRFESPFNPESPHASEALGMVEIDLVTENLPADIALLGANEIPYEIIAGSENEPLAIRLADPDGLPIVLTQKEGEINEAPGYQRTFPGPTIYVSNLADSLAFYKEIGFHLASVEEGVATVYLSNSRTVRLVESDTEIPAYEDVNHLGIARVAIQTTDIDQDIAILQEAGVQFYTPEAILPSGPLGFLRYVCFEDPDGTVIELVEYVQ